MKTIFSLQTTRYVILTLCLTFSTNGFSQDLNIGDTSIIGIWEFKLEEKGMDVKLFFQFNKSDQDSIQCLADIPEFGFRNIPAGKFVFKDNKFQIAGFKGEYNIEEDKVYSEIFMFGKNYSIQMTRIDMIPTYEVKCPERNPDWKFETNAAIWSSPSFYKGRVLFGNEEGYLFAVNLNYKTLEWSFKSEGAIRSKPLALDGNIWFSSDDGYLYSLDVETGKQQWKTYIGNNVSPRINLSKDDYTFDYLCSSPIYSTGKIYIGSMDSCIYAVNANNGNIIWKFQTMGRIRSTPVVHEGNVYVGSWDNKMYVLDVEHGNLRWEYDAGLYIQSSPLIINDQLIFGSRAASVFSLNRISGDELWKINYWGSWVESSPVFYDGTFFIGSSDYRKLFAFDPANGQPLWKFHTEGWTWPTPVVTDKAVYIGTVGTLFYADGMKGNFYAVNKSTGKPIWKIIAEPISDAYAFGFASSPVSGDGWIFFGGLDGIMYGIKE